MRHLRKLVLWAGAALGLLAVAAGIAVAFGGFGFLIFRSGSMSPEIPTGGLALSRTVQAADIEAGDVVSVVAANGERVTHRVVSTTLRGDETTLVLKGDANTTEDSELYVVTSAERVVGSVPFGGYVVAHALTPPGLVALASVSLMLIMITGGRPDEEEPHGPRVRPRHRGRMSGRRRTLIIGSVVVAVIGGGAAVAQTSGTLATFTDKPTTTASITADTLLPPASSNCASGSGNNSVTITWPHRSTRYDYVVTVKNAGGTQVGSAQSVVGTGVEGSTQSAVINRGLTASVALFGDRSYDYTVAIASRLKSSSAWVSGATSNQVINETRPFGQLSVDAYRIFCGPS